LICERSALVSWRPLNADELRFAQVRSVPVFTGDDHWGGHEIADRLHKILETSVSVKITFNTDSESDDDYSYCIYITVP
jgi:hypothetical protein